MSSILFINIEGKISRVDQEREKVRFRTGGLSNVRMKESYPSIISLIQLSKTKFVLSYEKKTFLFF